MLILLIVVVVGFLVLSHFYTKEPDQTKTLQEWANELNRYVTVSSSGLVDTWKTEPYPVYSTGVWIGGEGRKFLMNDLVKDVKCHDWDILFSPEKK